MYIVFPVIFLVLLLLILPLKLHVQLNVNLKENKLEYEPINGFKNNVCLKVLFLLPVFSKSLFCKRQKRKKTKNNKNNNHIFKILLKCIKVSKFILSFGFNTYNYILNSYINSLLNMSLCIYINNSQKFNLDKLYYQIYLSNEPSVINLDATISLIPVQFIFQYFKFKLINNKKVEPNTTNSYKKCIN